MMVYRTPNLIEATLEMMINKPSIWNVHSNVISHIDSLQGTQIFKFSKG